jgi:acyl carrier protein
MDMTELRTITAEALGKKVEDVGANPEWDSLDKLEIITHLHDVLGDSVKDLGDLDNFSDLESLAQLLREGGIVD